jgi:hypothetical protein
MQLIAVVELKLRKGGTEYEGSVFDKEVHAFVRM